MLRRLQNYKVFRISNIGVIRKINLLIERDTDERVLWLKVCALLMKNSA